MWNRQRERRKKVRKKEEDEEMKTDERAFSYEGSMWRRSRNVRESKINSIAESHLLAIEPNKMSYKQRVWRE